MGLKITQVDAFTSQPFRGNPAAVCILPQPRDGSWMQLVAREMNLSETAFLNRQNDGYRLRWFTPTVEVALCGHATLASAHVLWEEGHLSSGEQAHFHTQSGLLTASRAAESGSSWTFRLWARSRPPCPRAWKKRWASRRGTWAGIAWK
jgi:PhzF family phenazine biosynthesis protein